RYRREFSRPGYRRASCANCSRPNSWPVALEDRTTVATSNSIEQRISSMERRRMDNEQMTRSMKGDGFDGTGQNGSQETDTLNRGVEDPSETPEGMDSGRARKIIERRAGKVNEEDVEKLQSTLKEKIKGLKDLEDGLFW